MQHKQAFTLIELMVVMAIIALGSIATVQAVSGNMSHLSLAHAADYAKQIMKAERSKTIFPGEQVRSQITLHRGQSYYAVETVRHALPYRLTVSPSDSEKLVLESDPSDVATYTLVRTDADHQIQQILPFRANTELTFAEAGIASYGSTMLYVLASTDQSETDPVYNTFQVFFFDQEFSQDAIRLESIRCVPDLDDCNASDADQVIIDYFPNLQTTYTVRNTSDFETSPAGVALELINGLSQTTTLTL